MFRLLARVWMSLAVLGLVLSASAHAAAVLGADLPPAVMALHAGVFVVGLPALLAARRARPDWHGAWRRAGLLAHRPWWLQTFVGGLFVYALANFVFTLWTGAGLGHTPLHSGWTSAAVVRLFSGHWMLFYGVSVAAFYPALHPMGAEPALEPRRCPFGHVVPPGVELCPQCEWRVERD
jgi:hypothetical protein